jgi:hypothetical protein
MEKIFPPRQVTVYITELNLFVHVDGHNPTAANSGTVNKVCAVEQNQANPNNHSNPLNTVQLSTNALLPFPHFLKLPSVVRGAGWSKFRHHFVCTLVVRVSLVTPCWTLCFVICLCVYISGTSFVGYTMLDIMFCNML